MFNHAQLPTRAQAQEVPLEQLDLVVGGKGSAGHGSTAGIVFLVFQFKMVAVKT